MRYELRTHDEHGRGALISEATTEEILARWALRRWPDLVACPYENGDDTVLCVWQSLTGAALGAPDAVAWKPTGSGPWQRRLWCMRCSTREE